MTAINVTQKEVLSIVFQGWLFDDYDYLLYA